MARYLEQLRSERVEVVTPVDPGVGAGRFFVDHVIGVLPEQIDGGPGGVDEKVFLARGEPEELESFLGLGVIPKSPELKTPT